MWSNRLLDIGVSRTTDPWTSFPKKYSSNEKYCGNNKKLLTTVARVRYLGVLLYVFCVLRALGRWKNVLHHVNRKLQWPSTHSRDSGVSDLGHQEANVVVYHRPLLHHRMDHEPACSQGTCQVCHHHTLSMRRCKSFICLGSSPGLPLGVPQHWKCPMPLQRCDASREFFW